MTRKYNCKHRRGPSHYPERLAARGKSTAAVHMKMVSKKDIIDMLKTQGDIHTLNRVLGKYEDFLDMDL